VQQAIEISFVFSNLAKTVFPSAVPVKEIRSSLSEAHDVSGGRSK
jgi:hypothetical protein